MKNRITEEQKKKAIEWYFDEYTVKAKETISDPDKVEKMLKDIEKKCSTIPALGDALSVIPTMISLVRSFIKKEYDDIPTGTIVAIIAALAYFLAPIDLIPDVIPGIGYADDAAVIYACLNLAKADLDKYKQWRDNRITE